ncbi:MAG TPA: TRAP transporter small permease [Longimicrobiales bacterium]|nr:TRAP transporter small permease [Longimicrobiales bacterium]
MRKAYEALLKALETFTALLGVAMFAVVILGVTFRYVLDSSLSWYDEFAEFILVWLTMYGSVLALARGQHIGFEAIVERFPARLRRATEVLSTLLILGFSAILLVSGWILIRAMATETAVSVPEVKMGWIYSVMPITGSLMLLVCLVQLAALATRGSSPPANGVEERR